MHAAFRDHLAVEMREFFQVPQVLQQHRTAWAGGEHILVVGDGGARGGREALGHGQTPFSGKNNSYMLLMLENYCFYK